MNAKEYMGNLDKLEEHVVRTLGDLKFRPSLFDWAKSLEEFKRRMIFIRDIYCIGVPDEIIDTICQNACKSIIASKKNTTEAVEVFKDAFNEYKRCFFVDNLDEPKELNKKKIDKVVIHRVSDEAAHDFMNKYIEHQKMYNTSINNINKMMSGKKVKNGFDLFQEMYDSIDREKKSTDAKIEGCYPITKGLNFEEEYIVHFLCNMLESDAFDCEGQKLRDIIFDLLFLLRVNTGIGDIEKHNVDFVMSLFENLDKLGIHSDKINTATNIERRCFAKAIINGLTGVSKTPYDDAKAFWESVKNTEGPIAKKKEITKEEGVKPTMDDNNPKRGTNTVNVKMSQDDFEKALQETLRFIIEEDVTNSADVIELVDFDFLIKNLADIRKCLNKRWEYKLKLLVCSYVVIEQNYVTVDHINYMPKDTVTIAEIGADNGEFIKAYRDIKYESFVKLNENYETASGLVEE